MMNKKEQKNKFGEEEEKITTTLIAAN